MLITMDTLVAEHHLTVDGIVHVGAHLGEEAAAYSKYTSNVWWIEANSDLIPALTQQVGEYGHHVIQALITDQDDDEIMFKITNNGQSSSIYEFGTHSVVSPDVWFVDKQQLHTITLDTLNAGQFDGCNFLNMDIQGAELLALKGGVRLLSQMDALYLEINVDELYLGCARLPQLDAFLAEHGFRRVATAMAGNAGWGDALYVR